MKRVFVICSLLLVCSFIAVFAYAEELDLSRYTYEELKIIRDKADELILAMDRQYAIEHGDRIISFSNEKELVFINKTLLLKPEITRVVEDAPKDTTLLWTTSDPTIATVNGSGTVTGVSVGEAIITATAKDNEYIFGSVIVQIINPVRQVIPNETTINLFLNNNPADANMILSYSIMPENAYYTGVTWESSDNDIVTVDETGYITGVAPGSATITIISDEPVTKESQPKKATIKVTVVQAVTSLNLETDKISIAKGKTAKLMASIVPDNATIKKVLYTSSDTKIATVATDGTITAKAVGTCTITCSTTDGSNLSDQCTIEVIQGVTGVRLSGESSIKLAKGMKIEVVATVLPNDATNKKVIWDSSDQAIATVSDGTITAISGGDCIITATTIEGAKTASVKVHVPTFSVANNECSVFSKNGLTIPVDADLSVLYHLSITNNGGSYFDVRLVNQGLKIIPKQAGTGTIVVSNKEAPRDNVTIKIIIDHAAVYDTYSYPKIDYDSAARYPDRYKGYRCSFTGQVLQVVQGSSSTQYRISSKGRYDDVVYVVIDNKDITTPILEDDYVTVYGTHDGNLTYTSIMGAKITIPNVIAERINIRK